MNKTCHCLVTRLSLSSIHLHAGDVLPWPRAVPAPAPDAGGYGRGGELLHIKHVQHPLHSLPLGKMSEKGFLIYHSRKCWILNKNVLVHFLRIKAVNIWLLVDSALALTHVRGESLSQQQLIRFDDPPASWTLQGASFRPQLRRTEDASADLFTLSMNFELLRISFETKFLVKVRNNHSYLLFLVKTYCSELGNILQRAWGQLLGYWPET